MCVRACVSACVRVCGFVNICVKLNIKDNYNPYANYSLQTWIEIVHNRTKLFNIDFDTLCVTFANTQNIYSLTIVYNAFFI